MKSRAIIFTFLVLIGAGCALLKVQPVTVQGTAMLPALKDGDRIIVDRGFEKLERGDIVVFYVPYDQTKSMIKRIIGLPNDMVEIREGVVHINGVALQEPYVEPKFNLSARSSPPIQLSPNHYYILGDNRDNSNDSRIWGPLDRKLIYGKYVKKYF